MKEEFRPTIRIEAGRCIIRLGADDAAILRASLQECSCAAVRSIETREVRRWFLSLVSSEFYVPLGQLHGVRVAIGQCPCGAPLPAIRDRLGKALARAGV